MMTTSLNFPSSLDHDAFDIALKISAREDDAQRTLLTQFQQLVDAGARIDSVFNMTYMMRGATPIALPITALELMLATWPAEHRADFIEQLGDISSYSFPNMSQCLHVLNKSGLEQDVILESTSSEATFTNLLWMAERNSTSAFKTPLFKIGVWDLIVLQRMGEKFHGFDHRKKDVDERLQHIIHQHRFLSPSSDPKLLKDLRQRIIDNSTWWGNNDPVGPNVVLYLVRGVDQSLQSSDDYQDILKTLGERERNVVERMRLSIHLPENAGGVRASRKI